jgi:hypothetical protein
VIAQNIECGRTNEENLLKTTKEDVMEWGIVMAGAGLFLMVVLTLEHVEVGEGEEFIRLPYFEPEYESLTINPADYRFA